MSVQTIERERQREREGGEGGREGEREDITRFICHMNLKHACINLLNIQNAIQTS